MPAPEKVHRLVERFERHIVDYKSGRYKEAQVRKEFIDPFFKALGWDVENEQGRPEPLKEVIHEASVRINDGKGRIKAPDYSFRIGGKRTFFVEAKKPSVNLKDNIHPAFQLRRYGWSANLPLSILTDFEEFAVYNCTYEPQRTDRASKARDDYFEYTDYVERWDEIVGLFSREAVANGSLDRYAEQAAKKRGTLKVNDAFLKEIERWREMLAHSFYLHNPDLSQRELNTAVTRTIDRIIFLRIAEDRGIEPYGELATLTDGERVYARLIDRFRTADARYNSGLFHFGHERGRPGHPDTLTPGLALEDTTLKHLLRNLYYPDSPYAFDVMPAEILGQVYEQFLGKVIVLRGRQATVEEKPEVKKAGGVYYTPAYIVEYIVRHTVGRLLDGKKVEHVETLAFLDPACGSGSFLLGAYQYLLDWYLRQYTATGTAAKQWARRKRPRLYQDEHDEWRLTVDEKKRILLAHLYGVDIDPQAVEVTKLSLLLKVLEGETMQTLQLFRERVLPELADNIKCGNSLIGTDFYETAAAVDLTEDEERHINAFDWEEEFAETMQRGGFDVVIGNPPYVRQESLKEYKSYFERHYESYAGTADLYVYFMEKSIKLLREGGRYGIIVSRSFLHTTYAKNLRPFIHDNSAIISFVDFGGLAVFKEAKDTYVCIPLLTKNEQSETVVIAEVKSLNGLDLEEYVAAQQYVVPIKRFEEDTWSLRRQEEVDVFHKICQAGIPLGKFTSEGIFRGIITGLNDAFIIDSETRCKLIEQDDGSAKLIKPFPGGQDIRRYALRDNLRYVIAIPDHWTTNEILGRDQVLPNSESEAWNWLKENYGAIAEHLAPFAEKARKRYDKGEYWWELRACAYYDVLGRSKIMYPDITKHPRFYLDWEGIYAANTVYMLDSDDPYLLGILNSKIFWFSISNISIPFGTREGKYRYRLFSQYMEQVPIRPIDFEDSEDVARHDRMVQLVEQMLDLHQRRQAAQMEHDRTSLTRRIHATDRQIDALVYELYGLTDAEIEIVEVATQ